MMKGVKGARNRFGRAKKNDVGPDSLSVTDHPDESCSSGCSTSDLIDRSLNWQLKEQQSLARPEFTVEIELEFGHPFDFLDPQPFQRVFLGHGLVVELIDFLPKHDGPHAGLDG